MRLDIKHYNFIQLVNNLPPIDIDDAKEVEERVNWYIKESLNRGFIPTLMGVSNALGVHRRTLYRWQIGETKGEEHHRIARKVKSFREEIWEMCMVEGWINPIAGIFIGKNYYGYHDGHNITIEPKPMKITTPVTLEEISKKYLDG
jgi:hypothetical protein